MNKTLLLTVSLVMALAAAYSAQAGGPRWQGSEGWGPQQNATRMYDPNTVVTISGVVTAVETFAPGKGTAHGIHVKLNTGKEIVSVHLGPAWFIERQDTRINVGERLEITGSLIAFDNAPTIVAKEIRKGDESFALRDDKGNPSWSMMRQR